MRFTFIFPIRRGNVYDEHPSGDKANRVKGAENVAMSLAITRSNRASVVKAIPTTGPLTRATKGLKICI